MAAKQRVALGLCLAVGLSLAGCSENGSDLEQNPRGTAAVRVQMPFDESPLPDAAIAVTREWISGGDRPTASSAPAKAFRVASVFPSDGDILDAPPEKIIVAFNGPIDVTRLAADTLRLVRTVSGKNDAQLANSEVPAAVAPSSANPRILIMTPRDPLWNGGYRLTINADRDHPLADVYGHALQIRVDNRNPQSMEVAFTVDLDE